MQRFKFLTSEILIGTMVALLSIFTAVASFQGSMTDGDQAKSNVQGMQMLTDANAEYLTANQDIIQDYTYFDTYYLNAETNPEVADYYKDSFSDALNAGMERDSGPFDEEYYDAMYEEPNAQFEEADQLFGLAEAYNERGDRLQMVMLIMAVGLSFAAWASLVDEKSKMRLIFSILALITLAAGVATYLTVPAVVG